ncbi:MAG: NAD kinase [Flavobacteriales bacterium]|nr:NAD kinase [Flavobacteriales bacterium]
MRIGIYGTELNDDFILDIQNLLKRLDKEAESLAIHSDFAEHLAQKNVALPAHHSFQDHQDLTTHVEVLFSIGGDGTFLNTLLLVRDSGIPVIGINTGRLGFLAYIATNRIDQSLDALLSDHYSVKERTLLSVETEEEIFGETNYGLNEVAVHKKDTSSMVIIHIHIDGKFLTSYWADGLIISTPTGSTAYNLSCGGPIVAPNTDCFIITPKAPHNLTVRPLVVKDDVEISMRVECRDKDDQFLLSMDSRSVSYDSDKEIIIRKAPFNLNIVRPEGSYFFKTMRRKLKWGLDSRN